MSYSNSSLVTFTQLSPNNSGKRTHAIDRISPHCVVGQCTIQSLGGWFSKSSTKASSNYGIDKDGMIGLFVEEKNRSWCTSSSANDNRAITIECASDTTDPYTMNYVVYDKLVDLCTDICKRNGKTKLIWYSNANKALNYEPKSNEMLITVHRWFANKSCPGDWLYSRLGDLASRVNKALKETETSTSPEPIEQEPAPVVTPTPAKITYPTVRLNSSSETVRFLQKRLNKLGEKLTEDGIFGMRTYTAVRSFQSKKGLEVDGICGPKTWAALIKDVNVAVAKEVISGKWSNWPERQKLLEAAGFVYNDVKAEVDKLMGR